MAGEDERESAEQYIRSAIEKEVWSGFRGVDAVNEMLADILEPGVDEAAMRAAIHDEFRKKAAAEAEWPATTDCDRLDAAFAKLETQGICALPNAGYEMSDGYTEVAEAEHARQRDYRGYCFYHGQDVEKALAGHGVHIVFGAMNDDPAEGVKVGRTVRDALLEQGLQIAWNETIEQRLHIPGILWRRRQTNLIADAVREVMCRNGRWFCTITVSGREGPYVQYKRGIINATYPFDHPPSERLERFAFDDVQDWRPGIFATLQVPLTQPMDVAVWIDRYFKEILRCERGYRVNTAVEG
jgi:hypothetical protein